MVIYGNCNINVFKIYNLGVFLNILVLCLVDVKADILVTLAVLQRNVFTYETTKFEFRVIILALFHPFVLLNLKIQHFGHCDSPAFRSKFDVKRSS